MAPRDRLSAAFIKTAKPDKYCDGAGLWLHKREDGGGQWFFRFGNHGRRREMGLGGLHKVSLKHARQLAEAARLKILDGVDPIRERQRLKHEALKPDHEFERLALEAFEAKKAELKGEGKNGRWFTPLELHVLPKLGSIPIEELAPKDVRDCLAPIWHTKADTARKAINRINIVVKHAAALGLNVDMGLAEKAKLLLGKTRHTPKHIPFMKWQQAPEFYQSLDENSPTQLALKLLILTGVRSYPIRHAHLEEITDDIWTIPGQNMKGPHKRTPDFRVPLSDEARRIVLVASSLSRNGFLFSGVKRGVISDASMARVMERRGIDARPHGFRSTLRVWLTEKAQANNDVAEVIIAHKTGTNVERAYNRTDYLEQRRGYMQNWAEFLISR